MQITGQIQHIGQPVSGTSKAGNPWCKIEFVVMEQQGEYPCSACLTAMGEANVATVRQWTVNTAGTFHFDVVAREYNGRWYNDLKFFKFVPETAQAPAAPQAPAAAPAPQPFSFDEAPKDELPF